ncbi:hypothetical protein RMATCC62417_07867 [Rhizopus microsporus]|nr:hypothetical protein RMATCC62417_07867 [Rhizopus microsporus]
MSNPLEEISNLSDASDHEEDWQDAETEQQQQPTEQVKERKVEIDESSLRKKIKEIQEDSSLSPKDKAKRIQNLMSHGTTEPSSNQQLQNEIYSKSYYCRRNKKTSWDVNTTNATASCKPTAAKGYTRAVSVMTMLKDTTL